MDGRVASHADRIRGIYLSHHNPTAIVAWQSLFREAGKKNRLSNLNL